MNNQQCSRPPRCRSARHHNPGEGLQELWCCLMSSFLFLRIMAFRFPNQPRQEKETEVMVVLTVSTAIV
ncbi:MAG: hypothetical protein IIT36_04455, partial [Aeriscardovia sp.]|nr:hypothetical protein [Aeriscardovia sp.]